MDTDPAAAAPPSRPSRARTWAIAALAVVAALLRIARLERSEFWLDEACSALFASAGDTGAVLAALARDVHPPLHALLLHAWADVFGLGEASLRAPSALAGVGLVLLLPVVVRGAGGGALAQLLAATSMALSPWLLHYSTEARAYALLALVATALVVCLQRARRQGASLQRAGRDGAGRGDLRWHVGVAAALALASLLHHHGVLLAGVVAVAAALAGPGRRLPLLLAGAAGLLPWALWASQTLAGQAGHGGAWLADYWHGPLDAVAGTLAMAAGWTPFPAWLAELGAFVVPAPVGPLVAGVLGLPVVAALLPRGGARARADAGEAWAPTALLWAWLWLPLLLAAGISLWRPIYLVGRYDLLVAPAFAALAALGVERICALFVARIDAQIAVAAVAWLVTTGAWIALLAAYLAVPAPPPVHQAAATLVATAPAQDVVWVVGLPWAPLEVAMRARGDLHARAPFPASLGQEPGQLRLHGVAIDGLRVEATALVAGLAEAKVGPAAPAVWLVAARGDDGNLAAPRLVQLVVAPLQAAGWRSEPPALLPGLAVHRFVRHDWR